MLVQTPPKSLGQAFSKACGFSRQSLESPSAEGETPLSSEKGRRGEFRCLGNERGEPTRSEGFSCVVRKDYIGSKPNSTFFFDTSGAKKKVHKKETLLREVSPSAEGDKGSAPLTAPPFEKGGRKLLKWVCAKLLRSCFYHFQQLLFGDYFNSQTLSLGELTACGFSCHNVARL